MIFKKKATLVVILLTVVAGVGLKAPDNKYFEIARNLDIFVTLFKEVNTYYVDEIDPKELISTGIDAMLASLDPYTSYIPEGQLEDYRTLSTGLYSGIGAIVRTINNRIIIAMLYEGYSAHKAGLKIGDEITEIDGVILKSREIREVAKLLKGRPESSVSIKVLRNKTDSKSFTFKREKIKIENVPYYSNISREVGYIKLSDFTLGASREVAEAVKILKQKDVKKIIIDLRNNPGGLLSEAINISNLFLPRGEEIVSTKGKVEEWNKVYKGLNQSLDKDIPLVLLTNNRSASAAEIVAGVMQDYDRAVLIGRRTFGKGLVQATRPLSYNSQLKVTTAKYYTPSGRCIQAIDYTASNSTSRLDTISDSLKVVFKTKNGRTVYGGGGVVPDILIEQNGWSAVEVDLFASGHIFDYATSYFYAHDTIPSPNKFEFTDEDYNTFVHWLTDKEYTYSSSMQVAVDKLMISAKEKGSSQRVIDKIMEIKEEILQEKKQGLVKHKDEIKQLLLQEIVSRYYLYKGGIQAALVGDKDLEAALDILSDIKKYDTILSR